MNDNYLSALNAFQDSLAKMNKSLVSANVPAISIAQQNISQTMLEFHRALAPHLELTAQIQAQHEALSAPIRQLQESLNLSVINALKPSLDILNTSLSQASANISSAFSAEFISALKGVTIHENYVSVPEILIPDDFKYTEVDSSITHKSEGPLPGSLNVKELTFSTAISIVYNLIMLLITITTFLQSQQSAIQQQKKS